MPHGASPPACRFHNIANHESDGRRPSRTQSGLRVRVCGGADRQKDEGKAPAGRNSYLAVARHNLRRNASYRPSCSCLVIIDVLYLFQSSVGLTAHQSLTNVNTSDTRKSPVGSRSAHPNKEIEAAVKFAESVGWRFQATGKSAHAWGKLLCPLTDRSGCRVFIWSTPRSPENHAKEIRRIVGKCPHQP